MDRGGVARLVVYVHDDFISLVTFDERTGECCIDQEHWTVDAVGVESVLRYNPCIFADGGRCFNDPC